MPITKRTVRAILTITLVLCLALTMMPLQAFSLERGGTYFSNEEFEPAEGEGTSGETQGDSNGSTESNSSADAASTSNDAEDDSTADDLSTDDASTTDGTDPTTNTSDSATNASADSAPMNDGTSTTQPTVEANSADVSVMSTAPSYSEAFSITADGNTSTTHEDIFAAIPSNNGRVWTDKTVLAGTGSDTDEFEITLSTMAQSVQSEQEQSVPSDTVFILDVSNSMLQKLDTGESRVAVMVDALNDAINTLMKENSQNRVAVVAFGGAANNVAGTARLVPVLSLNRYDEVTNGNYFSLSGALIKVNSNIPDAKLIAPVTRDVRISGGTSTQWGIYAGAQIFLDQTPPTYTVGGVAVPPKPNFVLLTDGEPTLGWQDYDFSDSGSTTPTGASSGDANHVDMGLEILTVLTASYFKEQVTKHYYGSSSTQAAGFYTIGLGIADSDDARATLDPMGDGDEDGQLNIAEISKTLDRTIYNMQEVLDTFITTGTTSFPTLDDGADYERSIITVRNPQNSSDAPLKSYDYADYYAEAETASELRDFFKDITQMIVSVGSYATSVITDPDGMYAQTQTSFADYSGAVVFSDVIGEYMEVKDVDYLLYDSQQYNGAVFAHRVVRENASGGTLTVPPMGSPLAGPTTTKVMDAMFGSQLFFSGISSGYTEAEVAVITHDLLASSLAAGDGSTNGGQSGVYYRSATDFDNRIRYYADANGQWTANYFTSTGAVQYPNNSGVPAGTVCLVEQYFMSGSTHNSVSGNPSDLSYSIFEVVTALEDTSFAETNFTVVNVNEIVPLPLTGHTLREDQQMVRWIVPASLIPLRSVRVTASETVVIDTEPLRFCYSVGLKNDLLISDVRSDYPDSPASTQNGSYRFYTNSWREADNSALAHFVPSTNNPYYQTGRTETPVASTNPTGTANYATRGPVEIANPTSPIWYYELGNNGRLEIQPKDLEFTKTWDAEIPDAMLQDVYVQLYLDGTPLGDPELISSARIGTARWTGLQAFQSSADESGNAKPLAYTIAEGTGATQASFVPYDINGPFRIDYAQPTWDSARDALVAGAVNKPLGEQNWILDISKRFELEENGMTTTLPTADIDALLQGADQTLDFYLFIKVPYETSPGVFEDVYLQALLGEWGTSTGEYESRPIRYPDDFAHGQRSLWFTGAITDPTEMTFLLVEIVDADDPIDGYAYRSEADGGATSVAGTSRLSDSTLDGLQLVSAELDGNGIPTGAYQPFSFAALGYDTSETQAFEMAIDSGEIADFDFTNHLEPAALPEASLTLQKTVLGINPADPNTNYSSSFIIEGWESAAFATAKDLRGRIYYTTAEWADLAAGGGSLSFNALPPGYYTVTEIATPSLQTTNGDVYDKTLAATLTGADAGSNDGAITLGSLVGTSQTVSFTLDGGDAGTLALTNTYTQRPQLTIEKTFSPLLNPLPNDLAFTIFDTTSKPVRFVSYDALNVSGTSPNGGAYTIKDLPAGTYTIEELPSETRDGYYPVAVTLAPNAMVSVDASGARGTFTLTEGSTTPIELSFTNTYTPLPADSLTIKKELQGFPEDWGVGSATTFRVRVKDVTNPDPALQSYAIFDGSNTLTGTSVTGGTELVISENNRVTVFGLDPACRYVVEELVPEASAYDAPHYVDAAGQAVPTTGLAVGGNPLTVTVVNTYPHSTAGNLIVTKELLGFYGDWGVSGATEFRVRVYDMEQRTYLWFIEGSDASGVTQPEMQSAATSGLYWCVGNATDGFSEAVDRSKTVYSELPLSAGTPLMLQNLWADSNGWRYQIEEVVSTGEVGRYENGGASVVRLFGGADSIARVNTHTEVRNMFRESPGNLVISKRLAGSPADWGVTDSTIFQARVREAGATGSYLTFNANNEYSGTSASGTEVSFSQRNPAVLTGVPSGSYIVEESLPSGGTSYFAVSYEGDAVSATGAFDLQSDGATKVVTAVNTYVHDTGRLIVSKSLSGNSSSLGAGGTATVFKTQVYESTGAGAQENLLYFALEDEAFNLYRCVGSSAGINDPAYVGHAVDNVTLFDTIPFSADDPALLDNLWIGVNYRIEELDGEQYTVRYTNNGQALPQDGTNATGNISLTVINTFTNPGNGGGGDDGGHDPGLPGTGDHAAPLWLFAILSVVLGISCLLMLRIRRPRPQARHRKGRGNS